MASGIVGDAGFDIDASGWGLARYVQFDILNNYAGSDNAGHVGLSEVRFYTADVHNPHIPEPAAIGLLGVALVGLANAARRRRTRQ